MSDVKRLGQIILPILLSLIMCKDMFIFFKKSVQVGKDQEKAQSEKDSHSENRGGKN